MDSYEQDFRRALTEANLAFTDVTPVAGDNGIATSLRVSLPAGTDVDAARDAMQKIATDLTYTTQDSTLGRFVQASMTDAQVTERQRNAIQQNIVTMRNRVNELGVSEPIVQQQGIDRLTVQLPGVLNSAEVKDVLGKTATLEFRLTDTVNSVQEAVARGRAPLGSRIYYHQNGQPTLLKREVIATGEELVDATSTATQEGPGIAVRLNAQGAEAMLRTTTQNLGKPMAVVSLEKTREIHVDGKVVALDVRTEGHQLSPTGVFATSSHHCLPNSWRVNTALHRSVSWQAAVHRHAVSASVARTSPSIAGVARSDRLRALFPFMIFYYHCSRMSLGVLLGTCCG